MTIVRSSRAVDSLPEAIAALNEQVLHTVARKRFDQKELVRVEIALPPFDLLIWLASQREQTKYYWRDRETGIEYAGIGAVDLFKIESDSDFRQLCETISQCREINCRLFGCIPFGWPRTDAGAGRFLLAGIEAVVERDRAMLACNIVLEDPGLYARLSCLSGCDPNYLVEDELPRVIDRHESTTREQWGNYVGSILTAISSGAICKLVPARQTTIELSAPTNPWLCLTKWRRQSGNATLFGFQFNDTQTFIGATPERLYKRDGRIISTEAIAGTSSRGVDHEQDARAVAQLLSSEKNRLEHQLVIDFLSDSLRPLVKSLNVGETLVLTLPQLHHLRTPIQGELIDNVSDADLLHVLHPTPAVAGVPRDRALDMIGRLEPFNRGYYAGPVGWIGADSAEFAVAIRSALIDGNRIVVTAGAGVVAGSDPDAEWDEVDRKMHSTLDLILP